MKKILSFAIAITLILLNFAGCNNTKTQTTKIRVNEVTHSIFYAPFYVAMEMGYFEDENIEIELTNGGGADKSMTALLSNSADIGLMGPEAAIYVYLNGKQNYPMIFGQLTKRDGSFLIAREKQEVFDYQTLVGKEIIAGRKGGVPAMTLAYMLKEKGLIDGENITLNYDVQFNLTAAAFEGGTGDYCTLFEPTASEFEKAGKGYVVASIGQQSGEVPYTAFMALNDYILQNEELINNFVKAVYRGLEFVKTAQQDELVKALQGQFPGISDESIIASINRYNDCDAWVEDMTMKESSFLRLQEIMQYAGELSQIVDYDSLITTKYSSVINAKIID